MELKCALVFTLVSLLSVTATPHGYGAKGGAVAKAEAGAAAGAFSGVGLPLSIQSGPGFSGSFSKSSSSSFASSSASSSSSSFSFSGTGTGGFGLNSLGTTGTGGCPGGCQGDTKGIGDSNGTGSVGYGLQTISGVKSIAAAGASAGSYTNSKDGALSPCSNGVCPGQKPQCEGANCKITNESCTSGQCGSKSSSDNPLFDNDHKDCATGHCNPNSDSKNSSDCENGNCSENNNEPTSSSSYHNNNCASGQCGSPQTTDNIGTNVNCPSGECAIGPSAKPEKEYGPNDIPVSVTSSSTSSHDFSQSNTAKTSTDTLITSQAPVVDCKSGNCDSLTPSTKPSSGYSSPIPYSQNLPQTTAPSSGVAPIKPATDLTPPKDESCTHPNCKSTKPEGPKSTSSNFSPGKINCGGGYCDNGHSHKHPISKNDYSNTDDSQLKRNSYPQVQTDQNSNIFNPATNCASGNCDYPSNAIPLLPKTPDNTQMYQTNIPNNCVSGNCGSRPTYPSSPEIQVSQIPTPTQPQTLDYSPNCPSGNCNSFPKPSTGVSSITTSSYYPNPTPNENCSSGNCGNPFYSSPSQSKIPNYPQGPSQIRPNCESANCGTNPSYQNNFDIKVSQVPVQSHVTDFSPYPSYPISGNTERPKNPIPFHQPSSTSPSNCALGNCQPSGFGNFKTNYSQGPSLIRPNNCQSGTCNNYPSNHNLDSYPRLPSYPQNILPSKPLNCASGNCAKHPSILETHPSLSSVGSKLPYPSEQLPVSSLPPACTSGTCGNNPIYQQDGFGSSGYQNPSYSGAVPTPNCASGNCAINPSTSGTPGPNIPFQSIGSAPTGSTGLLSSEASISSGTSISSGNCASGKCPSYSNPQTASHQPQHTSSNSPDKLPDYVALGTAGGAVSTGSLVPSSTTSSQPSVSASHTTTSSGAGIFSNDNDKEKVYTGGFGGPPGILKPYEFTVPSPQLPSSDKNNQGHHPCSTGKCDTQSQGDNSNNKYDVPSSTNPCTSGKCEANKPHYGQSSSGASSAFAAAAAGSEGIVYTGGFGGPPGILKPFDAGNIAVKHQAGATLDNNHDAISGNKFNGGYGVFSGAGAVANAGIFSGSGDHNKAGGCNSGCGSAGHGSYGGNFGVAGGLSKSGLLEKLHNGLNASGAVAQSAAGAVSGAGASSFAVGGSFAGSSASAHSVAGSATKGGYGR